ncbi:hypothetical protein OA087_01590, partial [bacterium]|nr:hypothetical protein [bacterium]
MNYNKKFFILAGETSADFIGFSIMKGLKKQLGENLHFFGVGGPLMKSEGLDSVYDMNDFNIIGFFNTIANYNKLNRYAKDIVKIIYDKKPNAVITIDTKGFSLYLAKILKKKFTQNDFKIPLIHFVPPTIWAYGKSRIKKWKQLHDGLFCLFKNEEYIFKQHGLRCSYVGNPILEKHLKQTKKSNKIKDLKKKYSINSNDHVCLLFPGSRDTEIKYILPEIMTLIKNFKKNPYKVKWFIPTTSLQYETILKKITDEGLSRKVQIILLDNNYEILECADIAIACSGTITLELALF